MANLRWIDLVVIALYLGVVAWIGWRCSRKQGSTESYFVAGRSVPHWAMAFSFFATLISSITFVAYPGSSYAGNWNELVPGFMVIGALLVVGLAVIPFYRHVVRMSAYEYFGRRFGYGARAYSALGFSIGHFSKMGFVIYLLSLTIHSMTGWNLLAIIIIAGCVTIFYTLVGGLEAVVWTEVVQGIIMWLGVFICLGFLLYLTPGGPSAMFHLAAQNHKFSLGSWNLDLTQKTAWVMLLYGFFWNFQKYTGDQTIVQRYLMARSDRDALKGVATGALMCLPVWTLFMLIGTLVWAYYHLSGESLPAYASAPDKVFPYFLVTKVPVGLAGLFMAALFAAGMSTLASDLNCLSAVAIEDYYRKLRPQAADRERLVAGKWIVALCGLAAVGIAVAIALTGDRALSLYFRVSSILTGGIAGLFILAFLSRRANKGGVWIGIVACLIFTGWATLTESKDQLVDMGSYNFLLPAIMIGVIGHIVLLVVGYLASFFFAPPEPALRELTVWGWMEKRKERGAEPAVPSAVLGQNP
jgi:SSS family solute:Na+ symporter